MSKYPKLSVYTHWKNGVITEISYAFFGEQHLNKLESNTTDIHLFTRKDDGTFDGYIIHNGTVDNLWHIKEATKQGSYNKIFSITDIENELAMHVNGTKSQGKPINIEFMAIDEEHTKAEVIEEINNRGHNVKVGFPPFGGKDPSHEYKGIGALKDIAPNIYTALEYEKAMNLMKPGNLKSEYSLPFNAKKTMRTK